MAQHGYLREYDEDWDRGDERERGSRNDWDDSHRGRSDRNFMFGDRGGERHRDHDRGFFDRMDDRAREMFSDDDRQYRDTHEDEWRRREGDWNRAPRNFSPHSDDHYRSWRDKQMQALDRDYEDYCREREQQFHQDFDSWRSNRQNSNQSQGSSSGSSEEVMELNNPTRQSGEVQSSPSPTATATLGTNNSENSEPGIR